MTNNPLKKSKQREAIKTFLCTRTDHPTADIIYLNVKKQFPNISLGTVYRNLALLSERGEILKLSCDGKSDHFDANIHPHYHFICKNCGNVIDLEMESIEFIRDIAIKNFSGTITGHSTFFHGICPVCIKTMK